MISRRNFSTMMLAGAAAAMMPVAARSSRRQGPQRCAGARRVGGRLELGRGHPTPAGGRPQCHGRAKSAHLARRFHRRHPPRLGAAGRTDRAGRAFLGRHRNQRNRDRPEGDGARLCRRARPRCGRGLRRAVGKVSHHAGAGRRAAARRLHHDYEGGLPQIFRQRRRARKGGSALRRAGARRRVAVRRANHGGRLALQAELVRGVEGRPNDRARPRAVPGETHERNDSGARGWSPVAGLAPGSPT